MTCDLCHRKGRAVTQGEFQEPSSGAGLISVSPGVSCSRRCSSPPTEASLPDAACGTASNCSPSSPGCDWSHWRADTKFSVNPAGDTGGNAQRPQGPGREACARQQPCQRRFPTSRASCCFCSLLFISSWLSSCSRLQ